MICYKKSTLFLKLVVGSSDSSQRLNKSFALVTVLRGNVRPVYGKIFLSTTRQITRSANHNECRPICRKLQRTSLWWQVTGDAHTEVTGMHNGFIIRLARAIDQCDNKSMFIYNISNNNSRFVALLLG